MKEINQCNVCRDEDEQNAHSFKEVSHQKRSCVFTVQSSAIKINESVGQEDGVECSYSRYTYDGTDGYESGVSYLPEDSTDYQHLCKACNNHLKKARKIKCAAIKYPNNGDPSLWYTKYWMLITKIPSREAKTKPRRSLNSIVKTLRRMQRSRVYQTAGISGKCCRPHSFLKRNLRLCKEARKRFCNLQRKQKRKRSASGRRSKAQRCKEAVTSNKAEEQAKKLYRFVLDSSEEEDTGLNIRSKLGVANTVRKRFRRQKEAPAPTADDVVEFGNTVKQQHAQCPDRTSIRSSAPVLPQVERLEELDEIFDIEPVYDDTSSEEDVLSSISSFSHVHGGGFKNKEILTRLNLGYASAISNENRL